MKMTNRQTEIFKMSVQMLLVVFAISSLNSFLGTGLPTWVLLLSLPGALFAIFAIGKFAEDLVERWSSTKDPELRAQAATKAMIRVAQSYLRRKGLPDFVVQINVYPKTGASSGTPPQNL